MYFLDGLHFAAIPQPHNHLEEANTSPCFPLQTHLESMKMNLISFQVHLGPTPSYPPHCLNFRSSEQQWLSTTTAKKFPPSSSLCSPAFPFSFRHTEPLSSKWGWNAAWTRCLTYLSYSHSISHLPGLMTGAQMGRAEAEITSLLSRRRDSVTKAGGCCCGSPSAALAASTRDWVPYCSQAAQASPSLPKMVVFSQREGQDSKMSSQTGFYTIALDLCHLLFCRESSMISVNSCYY